MQESSIQKVQVRNSVRINHNTCYCYLIKQISERTLRILSEKVFPRKYMQCTVIQTHLNRCVQMQTARKETESVG